jgi:CheY-like chemotaxis protein/two-component sensor histidine kinase
MNAIIGYTALATAHINKKDRVLDYLSKIAQSSEHLLSLINDVLDMSRIESGKMHIEEKPENLAELMQSMRNMIQNDIRSKQLELYVDTMDVVDEDIYCDKLRLNQMLLNLISNAIKFTKPGGMISIRIRQLPETQKHYGTYEFRVKDTGIGMSREFADHIFEPFTRESSSTVSGIQGTGLGMSITKNIVDMMDGAIEVHTEQGKGSEFLVTLKFRLQSEHKPVESIKELEGMRSLVVDDDIDTCQGVAKMLRQIGLRAEWTMYGKEAVVRTREAIDMDDRYHVYIIDWMMPDMNGIETARQIRKIVGDDAPIIVLSAYDWTDIEEEARAAGVTDFVSKPAFVSDIRRVLLKNCRGEHVEVPETRPTMENRFKDKRVLLVEDNELNREIATEILEMTGVSVEEAENGKEAVDVFGRSSEGYYDLILMDVQMPVMDGYEATSVIRSMSRKDAGNIPILAMTANAFAEDVENARLSGMNEHLAKPLAPKNLVKAMETWLESRG